MLTVCLHLQSCSLLSFFSGVRFHLGAVQSRKAYGGPSPPKSPTRMLLHAHTSSAELTQMQLSISLQTHLQNAAAVLAATLGGCGAVPQPDIMGWLH